MDVLYEGSKKMQETYMKKYSKPSISRREEFFMVEMAGTAPACRKVSSSLLPSVVYFGYDYTARKKTKMYKRIIGVLTSPTNK